MANIILMPRNLWDGIKKKYREITQEMRKVSYPSKKEVVSTTIMVIVSSFVLAVFLWIADYIFQHAVMFIFKKFGV